MKVNCIYADDSCSFYCYHPICTYTGKMCYEHVTPCNHKEERDTLDEIVDVIDCKPLDFE